MTAFFFSALIQKEEGDRVEKTDGFSCDETAGKGIFNDGSGTDIILTEDSDLYVSFWYSGDDYFLCSEEELDACVENARQGPQIGGI